MLETKQDKLVLGIGTNGANIVQKVVLEHFSLIKQISEIQSLSCMSVQIYEETRMRNRNLFMIILLAIYIYIYIYIFIFNICVGVSGSV